MTVEPDIILSAKSGFFITSFTAMSSVNIVIITSLSFITSLIDFEISAPNFLNGSAFSIDLLNALSLKPDFNKFFAIGKPMRPVPIKPIDFIYLLGINSWKFCVNSGKNITAARTINCKQINGPKPLNISIKLMCGGVTDFK